MIIVVAPPNGAIIAAANSCAGTQSRPRSRLAIGKPPQVNDSLQDAVAHGAIPAPSSGAAVGGEVWIACDSEFEGRRVGGVASWVVGVDFGELVYDLLNGAGEVD